MNPSPYSPTEAIELVSRAGAKKGNMRPIKVFLSAVSAGCLLSFASASFLIINTSPWFQEEAPGLIRMIGSFVFPFGLVLITLTDADLCTGSFLYTSVAVLHHRLSLWKMLFHWFLCFWGNLAGSLFTVSLIFIGGSVFSSDPYKAEVILFATKKLITPAFHQIFLRGIGCNWLVTLALYVGLLSRDVVGKVLGMWWPIFAFVICGMDHVVANMFFIPMGLWVGTPGLSVELYIAKGIVPALIGNIIGGSLFVGGYYWWMYLEDDVPIDGVEYHGHRVGYLGGVLRKDAEDGQ